MAAVARYHAAARRRVHENPIPTGAKVALAVGGLAVGSLLVWAFWPKKAAANVGPTGAALVTTPSYVQSAQSLVNSFIAAATTQSANNAASATPTTDPGSLAFYALATLTPCTTDGVATNPTFVTDLAATQVFLNTVMALPVQAGSAQTYAQKYQAQTGSAWQILRTDGVLDGFTYQALSFAAQSF